MIRKITFLILLFSCGLMHAQSWQWGKRGGGDSKLYSGTWPEGVRSISTDLQGNVYFVSPIGITNPDIDGNPIITYSDGTVTSASTDCVVASFTCDGTYRWSKVIGGWAEDRLIRIQTDEQGNVYLAGTLTPAYTGETSIHIGEDVVLPVSAYNSNTYKQCFYIIKLDTSGNFQWMKSPQRTDVSYDESGGQGLPIDLQTDPQGNSYWLMAFIPGVYVNGTYTVTGTEPSLHVLKYDTNGNFTGGIPLDMQMSIEVMFKIKMIRNHASGKLYFAGSLSLSNNETAVFGGQPVSNQCFIAAYQTTGEFLWKKESATNIFGTSFLDFCLDAPGNIYVTGGGVNGLTFGGHTFSSSVHIFPYVLKLDPDGNVIWGSNAVTSAGVLGTAITPGALTGSYGGITWDGFSISIPMNTAYDVYMARFNTDTGQILGLETLEDDNGFVDQGNAIASDLHGNFYLGGSFEHYLYVNNTIPMVNNGFETDFFLAKFGTSTCDLATPENHASPSHQGMAKSCRRRTEYWHNRRCRLFALRYVRQLYPVRNNNRRGKQHFDGRSAIGVVLAKNRG
jgi:hypothetical protein